MGEFDSDEIYDPDDEGVLSMREAQQESRRRIRALCIGRKLADCTTLLIDDLIRELQTFMTRCEVACAPSRCFVSALTPAQTASGTEPFGNSLVSEKVSASQTYSKTIVALHGMPPALGL